jgi:hypothetical protein
VLEVEDQTGWNVYIADHLLHYPLDMTDSVLVINAFEKEWELANLENVGHGKGEWDIQLIQNTNPIVPASQQEEEIDPDLVVQVQMNRIIQIDVLIQGVIDVVHYP